MRHRILLLFVTALLVTLPGVSQAGPLGSYGEGGNASASALAHGDVVDEPYTLSAAYPNPFRERTRFDLRVKEHQRISVEVYNLLGQRVRTIYEGPFQADDTRTFTFEAGSLPSGLYLYRVVGETFTAARRVTLVQ